MRSDVPLRHRLLQRQLAKARRANDSGEIDLNLLLDLVSQAYTEQEMSLRLNDRATALMSDELTELTDRLRSEAEARARNSEAYLQTVLQNAAEAVISINREGEIIAFNRTAEKMFGYGADEILGLSIGKLFNEWTAETEQYLREFIESDAESFVPGITAARGRRKSGEAFPAEISLLRQETDGKFIMIGFWRDISERHAFEKALIRAKDQAETASRAKSDFLAAMSHELRTPLNAILGFSDIIAHEHVGPGVSERYRGYARDIHASGAHLLSVIDDILDISKIEAGRMELKIGPVDATLLLDEVLRCLELRAAKKSITLDLTIADDCRLVAADQRALMQILMNLLSNAVKFTPDCGRIEVSLKSAGVEEVVFAVADTGRGIAPEDIERVMKPFEQFRNIYKNGEGGTGLGLAIVSALARLHGGRVEIDSTLNVGTIVRVFLPRGQVAEECAA